MTPRTNGAGGGEPEPSTQTPGAHLDAEAEDNNAGTDPPGTGERRKPNGAGNSEAELDAHACRCKLALDRANRAGRESLDAYREAGAELRTMKDLIPRGQFEAEVKKRCGCTRQWAGRLMRLDKEWDDIKAARESANGDDTKELTVDSALALIKKPRAQSARKQTKAELRTALSAAERDLEAATKQNAAALGEQEVLKERLAAANAYIGWLEGQARSEPASSNREPFDAGELTKVAHVGDRWLRGASDNERRNAIGKLADMARSKGWHLRDLMRECGLEGKVHFPLRAPTDGPPHGAAT